MRSVTDRAVSTAVGYILMVAVAAILLTGLSVAASDLVDRQDERTVRAELDVYGERLAADIATADRLVQQGSNPSTVNVTSELPATVSDHQYTISIGDGADTGGNTTITLEADGFDRTVETGVANSTPIERTEVQGGTITISYDADADELVISNE